jgi:hypothetical protein
MTSADTTASPWALRQTGRRHRPGHSGSARRSPLVIDELLYLLGHSPEDTYLLSEDTRLVDKAIYGTILRTIASGEHKPARIGGRIGRPQTSLSHSLGVLVRAGFVANDGGMTRLYEMS